MKVLIILECYDCGYDTEIVIEGEEEVLKDIFCIKFQCPNCKSKDIVWKGDEVLEYESKDRSDRE